MSCIVGRSRRALTMLLLALSGAAAAAPPEAPVAASVLERTARRQPVDVLIVLDDALEQRQLRAMVGPLATDRPPRRDEYRRLLDTRRQLLGALKSDVLLAAADPDLELLTDYDNLPIVHARLRSGRALASLRRQGKVRFIDAVVAVRPTLAQSLPLINQPAVQALGHTGAGTTVAVLDTGVDYTRAAFGACSAPGGACKVAVAQDFATPDGARDVGNFHGTNVAGIVLGVAPEAKIAALDVFEANGTAYSNVIINAINWCITNRATYNIAAINMSLGGGRHYAALAPTDAWGSAIGNAVAAGIVVVAASGNNGYTDSISSPAAYSNVVSVGAFYDAGGPVNQVTSFSNSAGFLTMVAPGSMITAAGIEMQGTSQAAPHVAGAAAVLKASYPADSVAQTIERLKLGANITDGRNGIARPRLDLQAAFAVPPATYRVTVGKSGSGSGTVSGNAGGLDCGSSCYADIVNGESVTLTALHGPGSQFTGWSGACSGSGVSCTLVMSAARSVGAGFGASTAEDFVANGALPAGWAQSAATDASWAGTATGPYVGTHALKAAAIGHGQRAGIGVSGSFRAGTVSFARRVSSESGQDLLRFSIDGVVQGSWSGEVPWGMVAFPIGAGTHTLAWVYEKSAGGSAGSDSAWIDSVNLPWAAADAREARHDFNGDGRADILWRHDGSGALSLWHMDGSNRLSGSGALTAPADLNWRVVGTGDFDGDGRADILWRHATNGATSVWFMDGLTRRATGTPPAIADLAWQVAGVADFDADGKADVLFRHGTSGHNVLWLMNGASRVSATELAAVSDLQWRIVGTADFGGDGKADILWRHAGTGANSLWTMDGGVRSASASLTTVADPNWRVAGAADFDGDGKADILWRHGGTGVTSLWLMNGAVRSGVQTPPGVADLSWRVAGVGDFNADGKADVLWRHGTSGTNSVWTMNAGTRTASGAPPAVTDLAWKVATPRAYPN